MFIIGKEILNVINMKLVFNPKLRGVIQYNCSVHLEKYL